MLYAISKCIWALLQMHTHGDDAESYRQSGFKLEIFSSIQTVATCGELASKNICFSAGILSQ